MLRRILWGAVGLAAVGLAWSWGHAVFGPFVLPRPSEAIEALICLVKSGEVASAVRTTAVQSLLGWVAGCLLGAGLALLASWSEPIRYALRPVATGFLGIPPIAWLVLAFLWFGSAGFMPGFTVAITIFPVVFLAVLQGLDARDPGLAEMAQLYHASRTLTFIDIDLPQILDHLLPAAATALGFAWKICVMSEVIGSGTGIGGQLATARAHLDLPEAMAWILLITLLVLATDVALVAPLRSWVATRRDTTVKAGD
jgi:NitT/TauT family transport system permease protein